MPLLHAQPLLRTAAGAAPRAYGAPAGARCRCTLMLYGPTSARTASVMQESSSSSSSSSGGGGQMRSICTATANHRAFHTTAGRCFTTSSFSASSSASSTAPKIEKDANAGVTTTTTTATPTLPSMPEDVDTVSGAPPSLLTRECRIYKPAASAMQSGEGKRFWRIEMDSHDRWENPLMGWASTSETMTDVLLRQFRTKEDAIYFAEKQGWMYLVDEPNETSPKMKVYADNFRYSAGKLKLIRSK